jgi:leucyl aminopeptidase
MPATIATRPTITVEVVRALPRTGVPEAIGVPVASSGPVPRPVGMNRAALAANGFEGNAGQVLVVPSGSGPTVIALGVGDPGAVTPTVLRNAAASLVRAAGSRAALATTLLDAVDGKGAAAAAEAIAEGIHLASYRFLGAKTDRCGATKLASVLVVAAGDRFAAAESGVARGTTIATATCLARDLANTPPAYLTARAIAERAVALAADTGLDVEVFHRDHLEAMGCGGIVGVNQGSTEPPRVVKLTYTPSGRGRRSAEPAHLVLVGKGVMYDSGGISLKPSDASHAKMKMDMSGAAAVLAAMTTLRALRCPTKVTAYLMCTDNMPSGSALKLGDVLTFRNGKTAEIHNTDAEGRLILADGLALGVEHQPDAIVDIATLTGAVIAALGTKMAGVFGNHQGFVDQVKAAGGRVDESMWQLPLAREYRKLIDSQVADMKNVGGPYGGAIIAALFLAEFVGTTPWAHLDIAGVMDVDGDDGWLARGATGYGTRTLVELATTFQRPTA